MKTEIINQEQKAEWDFPCLGKHNETDEVVLFSSDKRGIVLIPSFRYGLGRIAFDWEMTNFTPLKGETIIKFTK